MDIVENRDLVGIIRSAVVFGKSEKHYDIIFYSDRIEILYLGEYKYSRMKQMFSRKTDALIYKIIKDKKCDTEKPDKIIRIEDLSSIRLRHLSARKYTRKDKRKTDYLLLEIVTTRGKYEFYINSKIAKAVKNIINKFYRGLRGK